MIPYNRLFCKQNPSVDILLGRKYNQNVLFGKLEIPMKKQALRTVLLDTLPVMTGYVILGIGFGILLSEAGYGIGWALSMSAC